MAKYGARVQVGDVASSGQEAVAVAQKLRNGELIIKAQVHAGGRGKGVFDNGFKSGVHLTSDAAEVGTLADAMIGNRLITKQTSAEGKLVKKVLVLESINIRKELYVAMLLDRGHQGPVIVASPMGGMDIEEVAEETPEHIHTLPVDAMKGLQREDALGLAARLGLETPAMQEDAADQMLALYDLFVNCDATQVEINPLALADDDKLYCVDAKITFDNNASFRQKDIFAMADASEQDPRDVRAEEHGLSYIGLDGSIGCLVNGAGLAMTTMDLISLNGGTPANFLDVGGSASEEAVEAAFAILMGDSNVRAILVNIFGGILRCDMLAQGIVNAAKKLDLQVPLVVRLEGTNVEEGRRILQESGLAITTASDLDDAAKKAVAAAA